MQFYLVEFNVQVSNSSSEYFPLERFPLPDPRFAVDISGDICQTARISWHLMQILPEFKAGIVKRRLSSNTLKVICLRRPSFVVD